MPRYFFDYRSVGAVERDEVGLDFIDLQIAHREAIRAAGDLWTDAILNGGRPNETSVEIRDAHGSVLLVVPVRSPQLA